MKLLCPFNNREHFYVINRTSMKRTFFFQDIFIEKTYLAESFLIILATYYHCDKMCIAKIYVVYQTCCFATVKFKSTQHNVSVAGLIIDT